MTVDHGTPRGRNGGMPVVDDTAAARRAAPPPAAVVPQLSRYAVVSALALAVDFAVFLGLNGAFGHPTLSGVAGYGCGIVVHYHLSLHFVFDAARSPKSAQRMFSEFVASGLVGLAVTAGVIAMATGPMGLAPIVAKVLAAAGFIGVFAIRRTIIVRIELRRGYDRSFSAN
jgi:putative flippase GtrA